MRPGEKSMRKRNFSLSLLNCGLLVHWFITSKLLKLATFVAARIVENLKGFADLTYIVFKIPIMIGRDELQTNLILSCKI